MSLGILLYMEDVLPMSYSMDLEMLNYSATIATGPWLMVLGLLSAPIAFMLAPYRADICSRRDMCFIDAACNPACDQAKGPQGP